MNDYGHMDDETPSSAISRFGIGTAMIKKANYAAKLYQRIGFEIVKENEEDFGMICHL